MQKSEKYSFKNVCNKLKENYTSEENEITYARKYIKSELKIHKRKDVLLKIKAEAEDMEYNNILCLVFSMLAMFFSAIGVIFDIYTNNTSAFSFVITIMILISIFIVLILALNIFIRYSAVKKWRKYVLCVVNDLIEKLDKPLKKDNKKHNKKKKDSK